GSLVREGQVDELLVYLAPMLIGDKAPGMFELPELTDLSGGRKARISDVRTIGPDIRVMARFV
ncbi:MAG TPA: dihydrofolate reductase family protein, partial [Burkholderiales bacterium]|nr:dihydrofolate reductase family protein [Burkholderiales bacterium]